MKLLVKREFTTFIEFSPSLRGNSIKSYRTATSGGPELFARMQDLANSIHLVAVGPTSEVAASAALP